MLYVYVLEDPQNETLPKVFISPINFSDIHFVRLPRGSARYRLILSVKKGEKIKISKIDLPDELKKLVIKKLIRLGVCVSEEEK